MNLIYRLTPHTRLSRNPLFALETRRVRWGESGVSLARRSGVWIGVGFALIMLPFLGWVALEAPQQGIRYVLADSAIDFAVVALVIGLLLGLLVDCASAAVALGSVNGELFTGRWDLLRLTLLRVERFVAAKHGTAQVRTWRLMTLVVGFRLGASLLLLILYTLPLVLYTPSVNYVVEVLYVYVLLVVLGAIYVVEPLWRMRAMSAVGVSISARMRSSTTTMLMAAGYVFALWIVEAFSFSVIAVAMSWMVGFGFLVMANSIWFFGFALLFAGIVGIYVWGFYHVTETWALNRAAHALAHFN